MVRLASGFFDDQKVLERRRSTRTRIYVRRRRGSCLAVVCGIVLATWCGTGRQSSLTLALWGVSLSSLADGLKKNGTDSSMGVVPVSEGRRKPSRHDVFLGEVDMEIDQALVQAIYPRVVLFASPEESPSNAVVRIVSARRPEDVRFLRMLKLDQLRIRIWPHFRTRPHLHVRIYTDAVSIFARNSSVLPPGRLRRWLRPPWLLFLDTVVEMPKDVSLSLCSWQWKMAGVGAEGPIRVLEVSCPRRTGKFLGRVAPNIGWILFLGSVFACSCFPLTVRARRLAGNVGPL